MSFKFNTGICIRVGILTDMSHCGTFYEQTFISKCPDERWQKRKKYSGKIVALINEANIGFTENISLKFRIHGATLIGTPTAGHNRNVVNIDLFGYFVDFIATWYYYPNGEPMQQTNINPNIEVYPVMSYIIDAKDEVIEAAIKFLKTEIK